MTGETLFGLDSDRTAWAFFQEFYRGTMLEEKFYIDEPRGCKYAWDYRHRRMPYLAMELGKCKNRPSGCEWCKKVDRLKECGGPYAIVAFAKRDEGNPGSGRCPALDRVAGNCDFNFNDRKQSMLFDIAGSDSDLKVNIEEMHNRYLDEPNISLMFVPGNLQRIQSAGLALGPNKFEYLDRLDSLIFHLNMFYSRNPEWRDYCDCVPKIPKGPNRDALEDYLGWFSNVYDYCEQVYGIGRDLTDEMIDAGGEPLNATCLGRYLDLAKQFWRERRRSSRGEAALNKVCQENDARVCLS